MQKLYAKMHNILLKVKTLIEFKGSVRQKVIHKWCNKISKLNLEISSEILAFSTNQGHSMHSGL